MPRWCSLQLPGLPNADVDVAAAVDADELAVGSQQVGLAGQVDLDDVGHAAGAPRVSGDTAAPRGRYTASGPASPTTAMPPAMMCAALGQVRDVRRAQGEAADCPTPGMCVSTPGIRSSSRSSRPMIQLIDSRNASLMPSHMPPVALPIRPGSLDMNVTMSVPVPGDVQDGEADRSGEDAEDERPVPLDPAPGGGRGAGDRAPGGVPDLLEPRRLGGDHHDHRDSAR
jgi:hypothetical protein